MEKEHAYTTVICGQAGLVFSKARLSCLAYLAYVQLMKAHEYIKRDEVVRSNLVYAWDILHQTRPPYKLWQH